jgi:hypothetical protein
MCVLAPLQQLTEEFLRGRLAPPALHKNVEDIPVLVDSAPQTVTLAIDGHKNFIEMPLVSRPGASTAQLMGIDLPELPVL